MGELLAGFGAPASLGAIGSGIRRFSPHEIDPGAITVVARASASSEEPRWWGGSDSLVVLLDSERRPVDPLAAPYAIFVTVPLHALDRDRDVTVWRNGSMLTIQCKYTVVAPTTARRGTPSVLSRYRRDWPLVDYDIEVLARLAALVEPHAPVAERLQDWRRATPAFVRVRRLFDQLRHRSDVEVRIAQSRTHDAVATALARGFSEQLLAGIWQRTVDVETGSRADEDWTRPGEQIHELATERWVGRVESVHEESDTIVALLISDEPMVADRLVTFPLQRFPRAQRDRVLIGAELVYSVTHLERDGVPESVATLRLADSCAITSEDLDLAHEKAVELFAGFDL